jgi:hypothetical protein
MWKGVPALPKYRNWWRVTVSLLALAEHKIVALVSQSTWLRRTVLRDYPVDRPLTPSSAEPYDSDLEREVDSD